MKKILKAFFLTLSVLVVVVVGGWGITYAVDKDFALDLLDKIGIHIEQPVEPDNPDTEVPGTDTEEPGTDTEEPGTDTDEPTEDNTDDEDEIVEDEILDYEFNGNTITRYNGTDDIVELPTSYSIAGTEIVEQTFAEEPRIFAYLMHNFETIKYPLTIKDANNQEYLISSEMDIKGNSEIVYPVTLEVEQNIYVEGNDYQVTTIGASAFANCNISEIKIPENITSIGKSAFLNCSELTGVYISDITKWCNINFGNEFSSPTYRADNLYLNNELVTDLVIPSSVIKINPYAFGYWSGLKSLTIPSSVTSIGEKAFQFCNNLVNVDFSESVNLEEICSGAFSYCSFTDIDLSACTNLTFMTGFSGSKLETIIIPENIVELGSGVFYVCRNLTEITFLSIEPPIMQKDDIPSNVQTIKVPNESIVAYESAQYFSNHADKIVGINA